MPIPGRIPSQADVLCPMRSHFRRIPLNLYQPFDRYNTQPRMAELPWPSPFLQGNRANPPPDSFTRSGIVAHGRLIAAFTHGGYNVLVPR